MPHFKKRWSGNVRIVGLALSLLGGCGTGGSFETHTEDPQGGTSLNVRVLWQQRGPRGGAVFGPTLPSAVQTVRIRFSSASGVDCCVAVDPRGVGFGAGAPRRLVLDGLPPGAATVSVTGFLGEDAPAVGEPPVCSTRPAAVAQPCVADVEPSVTFDSGPLDISILDGMQALGDLEVRALPFFVDRDPEPGARLRTPGAVSLTVVDAGSGIDASSVGGRIRIEGLAEQALIADAREACDDSDGSLPDCSEGGALAVSGTRFVSTDLAGALGAASIDLFAGNRNSPADEVFDTYEASVVPSRVDVTFSLADAIEVGSLGFNVDYSQSDGTFEGSGDGVACESPLAGAITVFNDDDPARTLLVRAAVLDGVTGPLAVARCRFGAFDDVPEPADFVIAETEATDVEADPIVPVPAVVVSKIEAVP